MAEHLDSWVKANDSKFEKLSLKKQSYDFFFRDALRPIFYDPLAFYSPADGIIIYQEIVKPHEKILDEKGKAYSLSDLLMEDDLPNKNYWVIGVFMTKIDIHINRAPTDGMVKWNSLDSLQSYNSPMIFMEKDLLAKLKISSDYHYLFNNQRTVNTIVHSHFPIRYKVVQLADLDVNMIAPFLHHNPAYVKQGDRFSMIRWGSQVDIVVPEHKGYTFEFIQKPMMHVEAAVDELIRISQ